MFPLYQKEQRAEIEILLNPFFTTEVTEKIQVTREALSFPFFVLSVFSVVKRLCLFFVLLTLGFAL
jgi:hypothetical protein